MSGAADQDDDDGSGTDTCVDGGSACSADAFPSVAKTRDGGERGTRVMGVVAAVWKLRLATTQYRAKFA